MSELTSLPHDAEDPMSEDMAKDGVTNLEQAVQAPNPSSVPLSIFIGKRDSIGDQVSLTGEDFRNFIFDFVVL